MLKDFFEDRVRKTLQNLLVHRVKEGVIDSELRVLFEVPDDSVKFLPRVVVVDFSQQLQVSVLLQELFELLAHRFKYLSIHF